MFVHRQPMLFNKQAVFCSSIDIDQIVFKKICYIFSLLRRSCDLLHFSWSKYVLIASMNVDVSLYKANCLCFIMRCFSCGLEIFRLLICWNWIHSHSCVKAVVSTPTHNTETFVAKCGTHCSELDNMAVVSGHTEHSHLYYSVSLSYLIGNAQQMAVQARRRGPYSISVFGIQLIFTCSAVWRLALCRAAACSSTTGGDNFKCWESTLRLWFCFLILKHMVQKLELIVCLYSCSSLLGQHGCSLWIRLTVSHLIPSFLSFQ